MLPLVIIKQQSTHHSSQDDKISSLTSLKRSVNNMLITENTILCVFGERYLLCMWLLSCQKPTELEKQEVATRVGSLNDWRCKREPVSQSHHRDLNYRWRHLIGCLVLWACAVLHWLSRGLWSRDGDGLKAAF